ncbi:regulatory-associated protein of mTOR isoform X2 [Leptidea sinapis]|uniref:regulatory-associated protein of mTOR isoform X2 n=1 Tax=Leptidea sinapis TaxID=189913 RepID=UPI0021C25C3E|nr:regulatory-associated protein of mTOR isoform X2 [Leptidea sinapis]
MTEMPPYLAANDEEKSSEQTDSDSSDYEDDLPITFNQPRHTEPIIGPEREEHTWRAKEKYKTHCVALVLCLNVGVDPPDVIKTQPCARIECWTDPNSLSQTKALETIGHALQSQYERWQPRARYKQSLDPTTDDIKKLCCSLRRNAKEERVLFHYNGHGVPKPTAQGEIWVFNRAYTQYIPLSMFDLQTWMGAPSLYVYDCSNAGTIINMFHMFAKQHYREYEKDLKAKGRDAVGPPVSYKNCIQLGACAAGQSLPMSPELPADLFTACLTTPVKMAMKWFVLRSRPRATRADLIDLIDKIPGQVTDRRTMLGELNWIFTAITDTIAWTSLPSETFQQLFRADLLTASLSRNFLLADRVMRSYNCTPVSSPALPSLARHPLWAAWEHTLELSLAQLPSLVTERPQPYVPSTFFRDQLTAFQLWLELGEWSAARGSPEQLPMVLQVLLSTLHRLRALQILCRFLALGPWAVRAVLDVGIFPYMLKLLQASAPDLRPAMLYIWAHIIAEDPSCQVELVNAKEHKYFLAILQDSTVDRAHRTLAAFVLAGIVDNYPPGQEAALQCSMISACLEQVSGEEAGAGAGDALQQWACIALGRGWCGCEAARGAGARDLAHEKLAALLAAAAPPARAAVAFALGCLLRAAPAARSDHANALDHQVAVLLAARLARDASPLVRAEILAALQWVVLTFEQHFIAVYLQQRLRRSDREGQRGGAGVDPGQEALVGVRGVRTWSPAQHTLSLPAIGFGSVYMKLWSTLSAMCREPHPTLAQMANDICSYIANQVDSVGRDLERHSSSGSSSLPPSPNTRPAPHTMPHHGHRRGKSGLPHTISQDSVPIRDRDSTSSTSSQSSKKPIVTTQYVEWAAAQFTRGDSDASVVAGLAGGGGAAVDCESRAHHERVWRRARNSSIRREARALRTSRAARVETQAFHSRCPLPPAVVLFHPYEQHAAVASKDNFGIWDWGTAAKLCVGTWRRTWGRITSLAYLNAHDRALLAVASHQGNLAVYRPNGSSTEPQLVSAWRALDVRPAPEYRPPSAQPLYSLAQLVSEQFSSAEERLTTRSSRPDLIPGAGWSPPPPGTLLRWCARRATLTLAGAAAALRVWDATTELLRADIPTQCEAAATALWRGGDRLAAGFADGSVRGWDERAPPAPAFTLRDHSAPVLCAARRDDLRLLLTGCGSVNQCISIYDLKGSHLNTIKFHEGFMGSRIGPVSCLTFHPLRCALGVGSKDSTVSVYVSEARR